MDIITKNNLKELMNKKNSPCISFFIPTHRAGKETEQNIIRLKNLIKKAEKHLEEKGFKNTEAEILLDPVKKLIPETSFWRQQKEGLAIFLAPNFFQHYSVPINFEETIMVADKFHLKPLFPMLHGDGSYYVLALTKEDAKLFQGTRYTIASIDIAEMVANAQEKMSLIDEQKYLDQRSSAGGGAGSGAVFHGHEDISSVEKEYLKEFFRLIDEGIKHLLPEEKAPLILAGVEYLIPIYQEISGFRRIVEKGVIGNPFDLKEKDLHQRTWAIIEPEFKKDLVEATKSYNDLKGTGQTSNNIEEVIAKAFYRQVDTLFVAMDEKIWGTFDEVSNKVSLVEEKTTGFEDLLDFAAMYTFLGGGNVYAVDKKDMPEDTAVIAIFRY